MRNWWNLFEMPPAGGAGLTAGPTGAVISFGPYRLDRASGRLFRGSLDLLVVLAGLGDALFGKFAERGRDFEFRHFKAGHFELRQFRAGCSDCDRFCLAF